MQVISDPWEVELKITPGDKELAFELTRYESNGHVGMKSAHRVPSAVPNQQTVFRAVPRMEKATVTDDANLVLWSGRWQRSNQSVADELALAVRIAAPESDPGLSGYFLGGGRDTITAVEPIATLRRFHNIEFQIYNHRWHSSLTSALGMTTQAQGGHPGAVSELSGKFLRSTRAGDEYEFTRKFPADAADPADIKTTTKTVVYAGQPLTVFEDDAQRIVIYPPGVVRLRFVPGEKTDDADCAKDDTSWTRFHWMEEMDDGVWMLQAHVAGGGSFPAENAAGEHLFRVRMVEGDDDRVELEVTDAAGEKSTVKIQRDEQDVMANIGGKEYRFSYPSVSVAAKDANPPTTTKMMLLIFQKEERKE